MSYVAGIDYSSRAVDIVLIDENGEHSPEWWGFELEGHDAFERARSAQGLLGWRSRLTWDDIVAVGIEEPRGHNPGPLHRVQGVILAQIPANLLVQPWIPSQWRKAVGLKGNASKAQVRAWALDHDADPDWSQDACDALAIAHATLRAIEKKVKDYDALGDART